MTRSTTNAMTTPEETPVNGMETAEPRGRELGRYVLMGREAR